MDLGPRGQVTPTSNSSIRKPTKASKRQRKQKNNVLRDREQGREIGMPEPPRIEGQRAVVVVEEDGAARSSLEWAVRNFLRPADSLTLLHVYPHTKSRAKQRRLRLRGFHLALSFKDLCNGIGETKLEIIVMEGDLGPAVVSLVNKIKASTLIVGLHDQSFLYKRSIPNLAAITLSCRIIAVKQHSSTRYGLANAEFSQVEITRLRTTEAKAWLLIFLCPLGRILKRYRRRS